MPAASLPTNVACGIVSAFCGIAGPSGSAALPSRAAFTALSRAGSACAAAADGELSHTVDTGG